MINGRKKIISDYWKEYEADLLEPYSQNSALKEIVERQFRIFNGRLKRKSPGAIKTDFNSRVEFVPL